MTVPGAVRVTGRRELARDLRRLVGDTSDLKAANAAVASFVASAAAARAPRRTGRLAGSLRGNRAVGRARVLGGGAAIPYGGPIHWGWPDRGIEANPFVSLAAQATEPVWLPIYEREIAKAVDKVRGAR